ncbi:UDP-glycosyltransferase UGT5-like [Toxorhynchites rutilus septentrionalis]|uniref:UDP-glycosyltransferase UGT5-like n=1 Tax=Toxorhynchites rutilus septentrionalis TaxID=329112 RepID=UPI0024786D40|nr:UDP-glycosyltransferase UGT5-like [Toxorhynchites rutilus septentrionalis]
MRSVRSYLKAAVLFWIASIQLGSAHRILGLFPHPGLSHFKVFQPIMRGLADAGHQVVAVSYFPNRDETHPNYTEYAFEGQNILTNSFSVEAFSRRTFLDNFVEFYELAQWGFGSCAAALDSPVIDRLLQLHANDPFDLLVTEFFATDCLLGLSHLMQIPFVGVSSCALMPWYYERVGLPDSPAYIPSEFSTFSERMSFWERFENWIVTRSVKLMFRVVQWNDNRLLAAKFGPGIPDVNEIARNTSLILVNQHYTLSGARPLLPAVVEVGGVHIKARKALPGDIKTILDNSPEGVVVISWGSVLRAASLSTAKRDAILDALKRIPLKVLWKWEDDNTEGFPPNVIVRKWLPQLDVLCHPNVRLFLAHGGMLGITEAVSCGVPIVITPFYGDQFLNAAAVVNRGMGVMMYFDQLDADYVYECINKGLQPDVSQAAAAVSDAFLHRPQSPMDLAVWSIENVLRNGPRRLDKSYGSELNLFVYNSWDVILVFCTIVLAILTILRVTFEILYKAFVTSAIRSVKAKQT